MTKHRSKRRKAKEKGTTKNENNGDFKHGIRGQRKGTPSKKETKRDKRRRLFPFPFLWWYSYLQYLSFVPLFLSVSF